MKKNFYVPVATKRDGLLMYVSTSLWFFMERVRQCPGCSIDVWLQQPRPGVWERIYWLNYYPCDYKCRLISKI